MSPKRSIFFEEWQSCLRAHYVHVLRVEDDVTEPSLRHVLLHTGLQADDLDALHAEAGIERAIEPPADDLPPETVPLEPVDELEYDEEDEDDAPPEDEFQPGQLTLF
jgi:hypothetical protein